MLFYICKNDYTIPKDPRIETPFKTQEVNPNDTDKFEAYLIKNNLHAYAETYAHYFKGRI